MRSLIVQSLLFSFACAGAVLAQDSRPAAPKEPQPYKEAQGSFEPIGELKESPYSPVIYSPDGKHIVYAVKDRSEGGTGLCTWIRCDADGRNRTELSESGLAWDDMYAGLMHPTQFSSDGQRVLVAITEGGGRFKDGDPLRAKLIDSKNKPQILPSPRGATLGYAFVEGDQVLTLDASSPRTGNGRGFSLLLWDGKNQTELHKDEDMQAMVMRVSPDRSKVAYLWLKNYLEIKIQVYDLKTKKLTTSPGFRSDDVTWDGPPLIYWDHAGEGVYFHDVPGSKRDVVLSRFDLASGKLEPVVDKLGLMAVLDAENLAVVKYRAGAGIFNLKTRTLTMLPGVHFFRGGQRDRALAHVEGSEAGGTAITFGKKK